MTWRHHDDGAFPVHVWPVDDLIDHDLNTEDCVCGPTVEMYSSSKGDRRVIIHHALDGRVDDA